MANAKIKKEHANRRIAFGNARGPLGELSDSQLNELALIAHKSGRQDYKDLFEILPSLESLQGQAVEEALEAAAAKPALEITGGAAMAGLPNTGLTPQQQAQVEGEDAPNTNKKKK